MGDLGEKYGFYGEDPGMGGAGEAVTLVDKTGEAWVFHICGGKRWGRVTGFAWKKMEHGNRWNCVLVIEPMMFGEPMMLGFLRCGRAACEQVTCPLSTFKSLTSVLLGVPATDPNAAWANQRGALWAAQRVPSGHVAVVANSSLPQKDGTLKVNIVQSLLL